MTDSVMQKLADNINKSILREVSKEGCCKNGNITIFKSILGYHMETLRKDELHYKYDMMGNRNHKPSRRDETDYVDIECCPFCGKGKE